MPRQELHLYFSLRQRDEVQRSQIQESPTNRSPSATSWALPHQPAKPSSVAGHLPLTPGLSPPQSGPGALSRVGHTAAGGPGYSGKPPAPRASRRKPAPVPRSSPFTRVPKQRSPVPGQKRLAHRRAGPAPSGRQLTTGVPARQAQRRLHPRSVALQRPRSDPTADGPSHRREQAPPGKSTCSRLQRAAESAVRQGVPAPVVQAPSQAAPRGRAFSPIGETLQPAPDRGPPENLTRHQRSHGPVHQPTSECFAHPEKYTPKRPRPGRASLSDSHLARRPSHAPHA
ncbi:hypothetical protein NDU88_002243 [Pleurodeles waltl]|uniref:Uncharacterized protein n=1 Tax=Pleurodeles waltl TaxID=8319 RepID=A0AAV7P8D7_PLEWA|nr:hypothetical protein NDU88_002243 [Pleurodeles waltl]